MRAIIEEFAVEGDFAAFRKHVYTWSRQPGPYVAFSGFPQMWLNQVARGIADGDAEAAAVLADAVQTPTTPDDTLAKIKAVQAATEGHGVQAAGGMDPLRALAFLEHRRRLPRVAVHVVERSCADVDTRVVARLGHLERWPTFLEVARELCPDDARRFERPMWYLSQHPFVGLNPHLRDMCVEAADLYPDGQVVTAEVEGAPAQIVPPRGV